MCCPIGDGVPGPIKRVLCYMAVMAALLSIGLYFTDSQTAFVVLFAIGLGFGLVAELLFWIHVFSVAWNRHRTAQ